VNLSVTQTIPEEVLYDLESERRVLSSMLHSEEACVEAYHLLTAADFYSPRHATIFELTCSLFEREIRPTYVELLKEGHSLGILTNPRDIEEIKFIAEHYIDDENIRYWVKRVKDKSKLRKFESFLRRSMQVLTEGNNAFS
jgi:replicative DNA helicase